MTKPRRSDNWGFPRWGGYGAGREAINVRICDRHGCNDAGDCPAPKSPNNPERWYFCQKHAAEYNSGWDYFAGLDKEEAEQREAQERSDNGEYKGGTLRLDGLGRRFSYAGRDARARSARARP